jgi:hypothetical protein
MNLSTNLPIQATRYLSESLNKKMDKDLNIEFYEELAEEWTDFLGNASQTAGDWMTNSGKFKAKRGLEQKTKLSGGSGRGVSQPAVANPDQGWDSVLFGEKGDAGMGTALAAFALGNAAETAGEWLSGPGKKAGMAKGAKMVQGLLPNSTPGFFKDVTAALGSSALGAIPGAAGNVLKQLGDISGANWFEANVSQIGSNAQKLAAQGAGSPWVPLVAPSPKQRVYSAAPTARYPYGYGVPGAGYGLAGYGTSII